MAKGFLGSVEEQGEGKGGERTSFLEDGRRCRVLA